MAAALEQALLAITRVVAWSVVLGIYGGEPSSPWRLWRRCQEYSLMEVRIATTTEP